VTAVVEMLKGIGRAGHGADARLRHAAADAHQGTLPPNGSFAACRTSNNLVPTTSWDWASTTLVNWTPYPPDLLALYQSTRRQVDAGKRLALLAELQQRVREWAPVVSLYQEKRRTRTPRVLQFVPTQELNMDFRGVAWGLTIAACARSCSGGSSTPSSWCGAWSPSSSSSCASPAIPPPCWSTSATREVERARQALGLDRPLYVQYAEFLRSAPLGDFGLSLRERRPAMGMVLEHFWPATAQLAFAALALAVVLPLPLGVIAATHRNGVLDHASRLGSLFLQSMPIFWLGLMLILLFAVALGGNAATAGSTPSH
jgi:hypothetical protein